MAVRLDGPAKIVATLFVTALAGACQPPAVEPARALVPATRPEPADVVRVTDGDTITVAIAGLDFEVRYIGIDAPEKSGPFTQPEWLGAEAAQANGLLVGGQRVFLERDVTETDRFDRLLRYVWLRRADGWLLVNRELVRQGLADAQAYRPDTRWQDELDDAERQAQAERLGLWGEHSP
jgi:micrococcal nuclease